MTIDIRPELTRVRNTGPTYGRLADALHRSEVAQRRIPCPKRILDYGCGYGEGICYLKDRFQRAEIIGYDKVASDNGLETIVEDLPDGTFDMIFVVHVLNVLPPEERLRVVREVQDKLSPRGVAVFSVRSWYHDLDATRTGIRAREIHALQIPRTKEGNGPYTYQKGYTPLELELELEWYVDPKNEDSPFVVHALPVPHYNGIAAYIYRIPQ